MIQRLIVDDYLFHKLIVTLILYKQLLSQLHQLRGRVGRGDEKSYCFLLMGSESETAEERLLTLKNSTDGFEIAEKDLEMRGGGDFFGTRQSGKHGLALRTLR